MMNWLYYLLEANLYLSVFYVLYRLLLHRETFYQLNRYYLIAAVLLAFIFPLLQVGYLNQLVSGYYRKDLIYIDPKLTTIKSGHTGTFGIDEFITGVYGVIASALLMRLGYNLYSVLLLALRSKKRKHKNVVYIELDDAQTAFSFFNLLFINPLTREKNTILKHEMVHVKQMHSADILFFEFVQILSWFNPITFWIKKDIKLLHEFIADRLTTESDIQKHDYAMFLIQNSFGNTPSQLTNQIFNQSILKRRINMLNKERSAGRTRLRLLYVLPALGAMLCASTLAFTKDYAVIDLYALKDQPMVSSTQKAVQQEKKYFFIKNTEKRLLLINGKALNKKGIITVEGFDKMVELNDKTASEKYGNAGVNGAVEFIGANTKASTKFPPPIVTKDVPEKHAPAKIVKFPPPIVKPKKAKSDKIVKFPPPIVTKDVPPPPPPAPSDKKPDPPLSPSAPSKSDQNLTSVKSKNGAVSKPQKTVEKVDLTEEAKKELSIAIKKNISKEIGKAREKVREAEANKKAE